MKRSFYIASLLLGLVTGAARAQEPVHQKYSFGSSQAGFTQVMPSDAYAPEKGYGFDLASTVTSMGGCVSGENNHPFFFSSVLAPGVYQVKLTLGDSSAQSVTTVKSETRRLMLEAVHVPAGQTKELSFLVHIRIPQIPGGQTVALKPRERDPVLYLKWTKEMEVTFKELDWDEKLTLEFSDAHPAVRSIEIIPVQNATTIYLVGDSTMTDQMMEPWGAWGMMFPRWFKAPVVVANYAESGESARSFIGERRWAKLMSEIHAGDFVMIQFGINDRGTPIDAFKQLFVQFITETKAKGATPILVTSQNLRRLGPDGKGMNTLGEYPQAMRDVAKDQNVTLIDLNEMSMRLYQAIGAEKLPKAFVDGTHQNSYGAYELSKCVVQAVIDAKLPFASQAVDDWKTYDPSHPLLLEDFKLPADPQLDPGRPGGPGVPGRGRGAGPTSGATTSPSRGQ